MNGVEESRGAGVPPRVFVFGLLAGTAAILAALLAVPAVAFGDFSPWLATLIPVAIVGAFVLLWNTQYGLCFAAFAIGPLGVVQHEFFEITLDLPEVLILALAVKEAIRFIARKERPVSLLPLCAFLLFIAAAALGLLTGFLRGNRPVAVLQDCRQYIEYVVLYLLVLHRVSTRRQMVQILVCFLSGITLLAVHGIIQRFTGWGIPANQIMSDLIYHQGIRAGSFYGATPLGAMMVLAVGITAGLALSARSVFWKGILGAVGAVCLTAAVFTYTRASWIAIAVCLAFIFFSIRKTPFIMILTVVAVVVFSVTLGSLVVQRMQKIEISKKERSLLERVEYYTAAGHIFRAYPVLGLGWGCEFSVRDININGHYVPPPPRARAVSKTFFGESTVHSAYLQVLVRIGLLGLIPLLAFLVQWIRGLVRERAAPNRDERDHYLFLGVAGAVIGYLFHAGLENFFQWPVMAQSFWLLLALTTVMAGQIIQRGSITTAHEPAET